MSICLVYLGKKGQVVDEEELEGNAINEDHVKKAEVLFDQGGMILVYKSKEDRRRRFLTGGRSVKNTTDLMKKVAEAKAGVLN